MKSTSLNSSYVSYKVEGPVVVINYKKVAVDLDIAKTIVKERLLFYEGKHYLTLIDIRQARLFTKEARDYFAKDGVEGMTALAIVGGSYLTVVMANLFMKLSRPLVPTKLFKTKDHALKWLSQLKTIGADINV